MKNIHNNLFKLVLMSLLGVLFSGCASMQSMSNYARTGDTVSIAVGGTEDSNALVDVLKKENISITITDSSAATYPITLRKLFKVYPDYSSEYVFESSSVANGLSMSSYAPPLIGQWIAIVDLVDPVTGTMPSLTTGQATISVSSSGELDQHVLYSAQQFVWENGNLGSIQIEILPGTGTPNTLNYVGPMNYDPVAAIEPLPQIVVTPSTVPTVEIAGGSFTFVYNNSDFATRIKAVPANHDPNVQLLSNKIDLGNGTSELKVTLLNPNGFLTTNRSVQGVSEIDIGGSSPFRSARFNLIWRSTKGGNASTVTDSNWQNSIQLISGYYIDMAGNEVPDITPVMSKVR